MQQPLPPEANLLPHTEQFIHRAHAIEFKRPSEASELPPLPPNFEIDPEEPEFIQTCRKRPYYGQEGIFTTNWDQTRWRTYLDAYYRLTEEVDIQVGRLLETLQDTGLEDNTLIIFTSDHGETLGDHGLIQKGCRFYEGLVRVPLIFSLPGRVLSKLRCDALVELLDLAPTFLELAGIDVPERMQGKSLLPILQGEAPPQYHKDFVRCEYYDALDAPDGTLASMYRDQRYKLVVYHGHECGELYDLTEDPEEFDNLWNEPETQPLKLKLVKRSFDATVQAMDRGPRRIGPM